MKSLFILLLTLSTAVSASLNKGATVIVDDPITIIIKTHLQQYGKKEMISAIQVSIKVKDKINNYPVGHRSLSSDTAITATDLFNIGSITKSFTAALVLIAESEGKLNLDDPLSKHLNTYPHWDKLSLASLLNMTSGLPNYSNAPKINYLMSKNLQQYWSQKALIDLVYSEQFNPPLKSGYYYSNTGYILIDMILSDKYKASFQTLLKDKILAPLKLENTYYPVSVYPTKVVQQLVRGYSYNVFDNPELLGRDVTDNNLSWAGAAGALVANSEDVIHWVEHLFIDDKLLTPSQKEKMQKLISISTGKPLITTNKDNLRGFGLGIVQGYDARIGQYWFYEGETLGYRAIYIYVPCNQVIISALFNSATDADNDHAHELVLALYKHLIEQDSSLLCKQNITS